VSEFWPGNVDLADVVVVVVVVVVDADADVGVEVIG
jgi:hypothetical protein